MSILHKGTVPPSDQVVEMDGNMYTLAIPLPVKDLQKDKPFDIRKPPYWVFM